MKTEHKKFIVEELKFQISKTSQKKVAVKAKVSDATISQMVNNNHKLIADEMWIKVKVNLGIDWGWQIAPTQNLLTVCDLLGKIQKAGMSIMISAKQSRGKTTAFKHYARKNKNVIIVSCKNSWSKKSFAKYQLLACGLEDYGTTEEMIERFQDHLTKLYKPVVIYDQYDKLKDVQKDLFMDYYNDLDGYCAFVLSGVKALAIQEENGRKRNKMGYGERWARVGSKVIDLDSYSYKDVEKMCVVNGLTEDEAIGHVFDNCMDDGRRVKREVEKYFLLESEKKTA